jgi:hypothetical protein
MLAKRLRRAQNLLSNEQLAEIILVDLRMQPDRSRRFMRYFTHSHLYNAGVSGDELQTYRNAFVKLINSLSWNTRLSAPEPIDPARTIYGIDIRQLQWTSAMWQAVEKANPYFLSLQTPAAIDGLVCYGSCVARPMNALEDN